MTPPIYTYMHKWAIACALAFSTLASQTATASEIVVASGSLQTSRTEHTASLLPNGGILIAGGRTTQWASLAPLSSAEIYNPTTGTFSTTGPMSWPRNMHIAATLSTGNVLVAGGNTATAEIYNPSTGTWAPTGTMAFVRTGAQAVTLKDGRVMVIGDQWVGPAANSYEIYDPVSGRFTLYNNLPQPRFGASAVLLADGRVLLAAGGTTGVQYGSYIPIYADQASLIWDPKTTQWTWGPSLAAQHMYGTATTLSNGKVLLAGGADGSNSPTANAEIVDPAAPFATATASMIVPRENAVATLQSDGTVLVAGGLTGSANGPVTTAALESYSPSTGTWQSVGNMSASRFNFTESLLGNGDVLLAGGATVNPAANQFSIQAEADLAEPAGCGVSIPVSNISVGSAAIGGPFPITAPTSCTWVATTNVNWITLANTTGTGNGNLSISIAPDTMFARSGSITINGSTTLQVNQAGQAQVCSPQVSSVGPGIGQAFTYTGGSGSISVNAGSACGWQVTGVPSWMTLTSAGQGSGSGYVSFTVAPSNGFGRSATLHIGQYTYTISQN